MTEAPWWLPEDWLVVVLGITSSYGLAQIWFLHCRYRFGRKPPRYQKALVTIAIAVVWLSLLGWLDDQGIKKAIHTGLLWGSASPILWMVIQEIVYWKSPSLAVRLGYDRRGPRSDETQWDDQKRELCRRGLFEDTAQMKAVKRNGEDS